jgi:hypothetical protein
MKNLQIFALIIASTATVFSATAQTYQWKDSSGHTVISDTPPPGYAKESARTIGGKAPGANAVPTTGKAPEAPKTFAEKDMDFKKRQQETSEKAEKSEKEKAAAADKRENCDRAQKQLALLESGQRIATTDDKGERQIMEDAERDKEMERARRFVSESCK